jgi:branched-chain amino acid transport system substrate-binding protein
MWSTFIMAKITRQSPPPIVFIVLAITIVSGLWWFKDSAIKASSFLPNSATPLASRITRGESLLITANATPEKRAGVDAFARGEFQKAQTHFQSALQQYKNAPDTSIYLWNSKIGEAKHLTIAVSVPISSNLSIAQEILRGVAQAQDEINTTGGIQGQKLQVVIVDDQNDPEIAIKVAEELVKQTNVLAVVGHNASDASVAAAPIYQKGGLVMVSPTSFANVLSGFGDYIFRAVPTVRFLAEPLATHVVQVAYRKRLAVCFDSQAKDNISFKDEFTASASARGAQVLNTSCDFADPTFNPEAAVTEAVRSGADALLLAPHVDRMDRALEVAQVVKGRLMLFGSSTLYTYKTLQVGQQTVNGLVLPVPAFASSTFLARAHQLWGAEVKTWRTAAAYDATRAILAGLARSTTRNGLQQALREPNFSATGAGRTVSFLPTGDRMTPPVLVRVQSKEGGYEFVQLK